MKVKGNRTTSKERSSGSSREREDETRNKLLLNAPDDSDSNSSSDALHPTRRSKRARKPKLPTDESKLSLTKSASRNKPSNLSKKSLSPVKKPKARKKAQSKNSKQQLNLWKLRCNQIKEFHSLNGHCNIPHSYVLNKELYRWVKRQRYQHKLFHSNVTSTLTLERIQELDELNFCWEGHKELWEQRYEELKKYQMANGDTLVPSGYGPNPKLASWVKRQRREMKQRRQGKSSYMNEERLTRLNDIGFAWSLRKRPGTTASPSSTAKISKKENTCTTNDSITTKASETPKAFIDNNNKLPFRKKRKREGVKLAPHPSNEAKTVGADIATFSEKKQKSKGKPDIRERSCETHSGARLTSSHKENGEIEPSNKQQFFSCPETTSKLTENDSSSLTDIAPCKIPLVPPSSSSAMISSLSIDLSSNLSTTEEKSRLLREQSHTHYQVKGQPAVEAPNLSLNPTKANVAASLGFESILVAGRILEESQQTLAFTSRLVREEYISPRAVQPSIQQNLINEILAGSIMTSQLE